MADTPQLPVSVEVAKKNLRNAATAMSLGGYIRQHPYQSLGAAFLLGMLLADSDNAQRALIGSQMLNTLGLLQNLQKQ